MKINILKALGLLSLFLAAGLSLASYGCNYQGSPNAQAWLQNYPGAENLNQTVSVATTLPPGPA
jgi:hypothetical protein